MSSTYSTMLREEVCSVDKERLMNMYIAEFVNTTSDQLASSCEIAAGKSSPEAVDEFKNAISDAIDALLMKLDYKKKLDAEARRFSKSLFSD